MPVVSPCPHSSQLAPVPAHLRGASIGCPRCNNPFQTYPPQPPQLPQGILVPPGQEPPREETHDEAEEKPRRRMRKSRTASGYGRKPQRTLSSLMVTASGLLSLIFTYF